jgi:hypothetical protein
MPRPVTPAVSRNLTVSLLKRLLKCRLPSPLKASSTASAFFGAAYSFRCHITLWPAKYPVYTSYLSFCIHSSGTPIGEGRYRCYLQISKTRYWWLVTPFQIKTFINVHVNDHSISIVKLIKTIQRKRHQLIKQSLHDLDVDP